jgi:hypothetical protein
VKRHSKEQGVAKVNAGARLVMELASFSLGRQTRPAQRTLIPSTFREMEGLQGQQPCAVSIFLVKYSLCCLSSH